MTLKNRVLPHLDTALADQKSKREMAHQTNILHLAEVVAVDDPLGASRIKVYVPGVDPVDATKGSKHLPWCSPLLPTNINHRPLVGERVIVIFQNPWQPVLGRFWIGPMFSSGVYTEEPFDESVEKTGLHNRE